MKLGVAVSGKGSNFETWSSAAMSLRSPPTGLVRRRRTRASGTSTAEARGLRVVEERDLRARFLRGTASSSSSTRGMTACTRRPAGCIPRPDH
jgi:hypothetical protein